MSPMATNRRNHHSSPQKRQVKRFTSTPLSRAPVRRHKFEWTIGWPPSSKPASCAPRHLSTGPVMMQRRSACAFMRGAGSPFGSMASHRGPVRPRSATQAFRNIVIQGILFLSKFVGLTYPTLSLNFNRTSQPPNLRRAKHPKRTRDWVDETRLRNRQKYRARLERRLVQLL